MAIFQANLG